MSEIFTQAEIAQILDEAKDRPEMSKQEEKARSEAWRQGWEAAEQELRDLACPRCATRDAYDKGYKEGYAKGSNLVLIDLKEVRQTADMLRGRELSGRDGTHILIKVTDMLGKLIDEIEKLRE